MNPRKQALVALFSALFILFGGRGMRAQSVSSSVQGTITDPSGAAVPRGPVVSPGATYSYFGNSANGIFYGPGINNWDITALRKVFPVRESMRLLFRAEFFNAFNHAQFGHVVDSITSPNLGKVNATQVAAREIRFALKLQF